MQPSLAVPATRVLRVCHVITGFDDGGAERVLLNTVRRLDRTRFDPLIVSLRGRGPLSDEADQTGVRTIHLGMGRRPGPATIWRLARLFRSEAVTVVHAYLYDASIASRIAGRLAKVPIVLTSTRAPLEYLPRFAWWLDRVTSRWCRRIVAVSQHTADTIVRVEGMPKERIVVIPNGVDVARFTPRDSVQARSYWGLDNAAFVVASIGRLVEQKAHRDLFKALALARTVVPSLRCLIAGDGPLRRTLEADAHRLGVGTACRFLGNVPNVESVLAAADVTVLSSRFEGMPNVVLEAMAMGCPVIATSVGGSTELVRNGETGFLVPPGDTTAIAEAMISIASSAERRTHFRARSREVAVTCHGIDKMIRSVEKLYLDEWENSTASSVTSSNA